MGLAARKGSPSAADRAAYQTGKDPAFQFFGDVIGGYNTPDEMKAWLEFVNMQVSFLSPPFGPAAFYLKSVVPADIDLVTIFRSFGPFICLQLVVLALIVAFPQIALVLVR